MSEATYVSRALRFGMAGALVVGIVAAYFASRAPLGLRPQPRLIEVDCLNVQRGPTLRFKNGTLMDANAVVGTYRFLPAVAGKHGPLISVEGTRVRRVGETIVFEPGNEGWFWHYLDDDTVEILFYGPRGQTVARRCAA